MINHVFAEARDATNRGAVNLTAGLYLQLVDLPWVTGAYTSGRFTSSAVTLDDIPAGNRCGSLTAVVGTITSLDGVITTDTEDQTFVAVSSHSSAIAGYVVCIPGATDPDRTLVALVVVSGDTTLITATPNGSDIPLTIPDGRIVRL